MPEWQMVLILEIISSIKRNYIFADDDQKFNADKFKAELIREFEKRFSGSEYSTEPDGDKGEEFASHVTEILTGVTNDKHFMLIYNPKLIREHESVLMSDLKFPWALPPTDPRRDPDPEQVRKEIEDLGKRACGFYDQETPPTDITHMSFI